MAERFKGMMKYLIPENVPGKEWKMLAVLDTVLVILSAALIYLSIVYAKERVIFSDTAVYMFDLVRTRHFVVPTNRFISILSQLLPRAGLGLGLPLQAIVVLYSVNLILIPVGSAMLVRYLFKQAGLALAILLFCIIMGSSLFYYPVSEFQMGLCLLFVYHGLLLAFKKGNRAAVYYIAGATLLVFITFSHPMCLPVMAVWLLWLVVTEPSVKAKDLVFPTCIIILTYYLKEHYFKAMIGNIAFDDDRAEGLKNFAGTFDSYFNNNLVQSSLKSIWGDHFIAVLLLLFSLVYLFWQRKWGAVMLLASTCFGFWLLVSVTFKDKVYNYYFEHLYQPLPFFIALAFVTYGIKLFGAPYKMAIVLTAALVISIAKMNNAHEDNAQRQAWLYRCFDLMRSYHLRKAAIGNGYAIGDQNQYWSVTCESTLLSSLDPEDSSRTLLVTSRFDNMKEEIDQTGSLVLGVKCWIPISELNHLYFRLNAGKSYGILDSLVSTQELNNLANVK